MGQNALDLPKLVVLQPVRPNGHPLILMNDIGGGGYARIGHILSADLSKVSQVPPGCSIKFKKITLNTAQKNIQKEKQHFRKQFFKMLKIVNMY